MEKEHLEPDINAQRSMSATAADMAQYLEVDFNEEGVLAAAEALHRGFEEWDRDQRAERFRQYAETVGVHWQELADDEEEEECCQRIYSVIVTNLSDDVTSEVLRTMFSQIGEVEGSFVVEDERGTIVVLGNPEDAAEAARGFDGVELCGRVMEVTVDEDTC